MADGFGGVALRSAKIAATGAVLGALVGGVGGRLAMFVLIRSSPQGRGRVTDDGFEMGRFTVAGSLNLMAVAAVLGLVGAGVYAAVRWLQPSGLALRIAATSACAGVGVGALLVHRDGVDFTLLDASLAIPLFVAIPAAYGGLLAWVVERRWPTGPHRDSSRLTVVRWAGRGIAAGSFLLLLRDLLLDTAALV